MGITTFNTNNGNAIHVTIPDYDHGAVVTLRSGDALYPALVADGVSIVGSSGGYFTNGFDLFLAANSMINNCFVGAVPGSGIGINLDGRTSTNLSVTNTTLTSLNHGLEYNTTDYAQQGVVIYNCPMTNLNVGVYSGVANPTYYLQFPSLTYIGDCVIEPLAAASSLPADLTYGIEFRDTEWAFYDGNDIYMPSGSYPCYGIGLTSAKEAQITSTLIEPYSGTVTGSYGIQLAASGSSNPATYTNVLNYNSIYNVSSSTTYAIEIQTPSAQLNEYQRAFGTYTSVPTMNMLSSNFLYSGATLSDSNSSDVVW